MSKAIFGFVCSVVLALGGCGPEVQPLNIATEIALFPTEGVPPTEATEVEPTEPTDDTMNDPRLPTGRKDGWQSSGTLVTNNTLTKISCQANFEESKHGAGYYTVQFGIIRPNIPLVAGLFASIADITWSVEGVEIRRRVSVGDGTTISGPGQAVKVVVSDASTLAGAGANLSYNATIQITPGARPSINKPATLTSTEGNQALAALGNATFVPPQNVGVISAYIAVGTVAAVGITAIALQEDTVGNVLLTTDLATYGSNFIPLVPGCQRIIVVNSDPANGLFVNVIWGIDG